MRPAHRWFVCDLRRIVRNTPLFAEYDRGLGGDRELDRFAAIETFVAVVETGSFSSAARRLDIGQPAVSKSVAQLEERSSRNLRPPRQGRRTTLTRAGRSTKLKRPSWPRAEHRPVSPAASGCRPRSPSRGVRTATWSCRRSKRRRPSSRRWAPAWSRSQSRLHPTPGARGHAAGARRGAVQELISARSCASQCAFV
jgi:hypothetical protein